MAHFPSIAPIPFGKFHLASSCLCPTHFLCLVLLDILEQVPVVKKIKMYVCQVCKFRRFYANKSTLYKPCLVSDMIEEIVWRAILNEYLREWYVSPISKYRSVTARHSSGCIVARTALMGGGCSSGSVGILFPTETKNAPLPYGKSLCKRRHPPFQAL